ncbi:FK506-binding protein 5 isoform X4 [Platichthys flesus]|uniref:FK506-binding protein 5 isoform X4 n=1 Tax=Platichthys flesus TaxID=8260 RepID=UPI002DBA4D75|nr:FK506-binding protein 5 isoform X4 [Platichthys flesus]
MGTQGAGRKRSSKKDKSTAEDDALNLIAREAEARLAAKRAARAEAREIRMKELERQQKELSDDDERMSVGSRGSVRSPLDAVGSYAGGGASLKKPKKKKKHKHKDKDGNGFDDDHSVVSSRSSRLSDESRVSRGSKLDLTSSRLSDDSRLSRASRSELQPSSFSSSDLYGLNGLSSSRNAGSAFNGYQSHVQNSLYEDSICSGSRRLTGSSSHPLDYTSYRSSGSRASSRAGSARASPVDNCSSVASYLRSAAGGSGLHRDLDDVTIPDFSDVEDRDYLEKGSRAASALTATTLTSLGGTSSRRGSGETSLTVDAETSIREIKEIHELKDQIQDVEIKYTQNLKEAKDTLSEVEEKYRKAMVSNAQLDNEKNNLMYQVDTLKDSLMELEELLSESNRAYEEKVKDFEREKHAHGVLQFQFSEMKETLKQSEELLNEIRQLRLKQDGFVREISDLQETVEWKDKKIGALERQKEYTDAIRTERDELREEAVKLKDILKKHGIVLGPDLSVNGDIGEAEVDGSSSGDTAHQPAPDSQTTEGNSMLGNRDETEELDPDQQPDILKEEAKENQLSSDRLCDAAVSSMETSAAADEQQTLDESTGGSDLSKDLSVDIPDHPVTEAEDIIVTSAEGNSPDTETTPGEEGLVETDTQSKRDGFKQTSDELSENIQEAAVESDLRSKETCPQQTDVKDISRDEENEEAEEVTGQSQAAAASGKRKKKKRRGKKKGNQQKDETEKENIKTEESVEPDKKDNKSKTEPDKGDSAIVKESKMDQVEKEQVGKQAEEVEAAESVEPTEAVSLKEAFTEPREDHVPNEQDKEPTVEIQEIKEAAPSETLSCSETPEEIRVSPLTNEQNKDQSETAEIIQVVAPTETFSQSETLKELCREAGEDEQSEAGAVESCPPETQLSTCDLTDPSNSTEGIDGLDRKYTDSVDESELSANGHILHPESKIIDDAEDEEVDEMKPECKTEGNTVDEPHVPSSNDVPAEVSESTNIPEGTDLTSASSPTIRLKSTSDSEPQPEPSSLREVSPIEVPGEDPEETTETLEDVEEAGPETEQEGFPLGVTDPEQKPDEIEKEEEEEEEEEESDKKENGSTTEPDKGDSEILKESKMDQVEKEQVGKQAEEVEAAESLEPKETASLKDAFTEPREDHVPNEQDKEPTEAIQEIKDVEEAGTETKQEGFPLGVTAPEGKPDEIEEELDRDVNEPAGFIEPENSSRDEKTLLETEAQVEHLADVENQTSECVELKKESDAKETDEINTFENLNSPESQKESSCSPAELLPESSKDKSEDDSPPLNQQGSDEEDGEDEEGQSFDFDDVDVEAAFETNQTEDEDIEEGVEAVSDPSENTQSESTERHDEASGFDEQVESEATRQASAREARLSTEEGAVLNVGGSSAAVAEDVNQAASSPVEEGSVKPELSPVHVARDKEPPHSGKGQRKNSKKGKGKGKEDCKMS